MPTFRKVDPIEIEPKLPPLSKRSQVTREYATYLDGFAAGDYGRAALFDGERRALVRQRLQAAARRRGLALRFRSGPGPLTFMMCCPAGCGPGSQEAGRTVPRSAAHANVVRLPAQRSSLSRQAA